MAKPLIKSPRSFKRIYTLLNNIQSQEKIPVLFLLMEFAPVNTTGNFRCLKFLKYLENEPIQPIVITFEVNEAAGIFGATIENQLLEELPDNTIIYRIKIKEPGRFGKSKFGQFLSIYFSIKDALGERWKPTLMPQLKTIIQKHHPKLIFTSLPPFSAGLLSAEISKKFNIPLILDMRDLWALFGNGPLASKWHYNATVREEKIIFNQASAIIGVTTHMLKAMQRVHPQIEPAKFHLIPNGFDSSLLKSEGFTFPEKKEQIVIGYVGAFYYFPGKRNDEFRSKWKFNWKDIGKMYKLFEFSPVDQDWLYRSPYFFFKTMSRYFESYPESRKKIRIEFIGRKPEWIDEMLDEFKLTDIFTSHGFVPFQESLSIQKNFDLLLATSEKIPTFGHYCLPSKLFDYVGQQKPILAFVTDGEQKDFLANSGLSIYCDPDDVEASVSTLEKLFSLGMNFYPDNEFIGMFERKKQAQKLSLLIQHLIKKEQGNLCL